MLSGWFSNKNSSKNASGKFVAIDGSRTSTVYDSKTSTSPASKSTVFFQSILDRLECKDSTLKDIYINWTGIKQQIIEPEKWLLLSELLCDNLNITSITLINVQMNDDNFKQIYESLKTCINIIKINLEYNYLSSKTMLLISELIEYLPNLTRIYLSNQNCLLFSAAAAAAEPEKTTEIITESLKSEVALANILSQNTNITILTYDYKHDYITIYIKKYLKRNQEYNKQRKRRDYKTIIEDRLTLFISPLITTTTTTTATTTTTTKSIIANTNNNTKADNNTNSILTLSPHECVPYPFPVTESQIDYNKMLAEKLLEEEQQRQHTLNNKSNNTNTNATTNTPDISTIYTPTTTTTTEYHTTLSNNMTYTAPYSAGTRNKNGFRPSSTGTDNNNKLVKEINIRYEDLSMQPMYYFMSLHKQIKDNYELKSLSIVNIGMNDDHCILLMDVLPTCINLIILNLESNRISSIGIEVIARTITTHPTITEVKLDNQRATAGPSGEKALIQALSTNTRLIKLSYTFSDPTYKYYANTYLRRNNELARKARITSPGQSSSYGQNGDGSSSGNGNSSPRSVVTPFDPHAEADVTSPDVSVKKEYLVDAKATGRIHNYNLLSKEYVVGSEL